MYLMYFQRAWRRSSNIVKSQEKTNGAGEV